MFSAFSFSFSSIIFWILSSSLGPGNGGPGIGAGPGLGIGMGSSPGDGCGTGSSLFGSDSSALAIESTKTVNPIIEDYLRNHITSGIKIDTIKILCSIQETANCHFVQC